MAWYHYILIPFSWIYAGITSLRNVFFSTGILKSKKFPFPVIVIGNLSTGGTGKTPMTEYILHLLSGKVNPAVLSRGYGRSSRGFREVFTNSSPDQTGDEPLMMKNNFPDQHFFVAENRVKGVEEIMKKYPEKNLIVLDDAFQHRYVQPGFSILLTTFQRPFYNDFSLPAGSLRERRNNAARASVIVVTKSPIKRSFDETAIRMKIANYSSAPVFFARYKFGTPVPIFEGQSAFKGQQNVMAVSGIANNEEFKAAVKDRFTLISSLGFTDHYTYKASDFKQIAEKFDSFAAPDKIVLTTQKDAVKWRAADQETLSILKQLPVYTLPIEMELDQPEKFSELIYTYVGKN